MAWNRFDEGYLSVEKAVQAAGGEWNEKQITLTPEYIDDGILKSGTYEIAVSDGIGGCQNEKEQISGHDGRACGGSTAWDHRVAGRSGKRCAGRKKTSLRIGVLLYHRG